MVRPVLDPFPLGYPVGICVRPEQMPRVLRELCARLRDILHPTIHVINPSKGQSYPMLNLFADTDEVAPLVVVFPCWEDNKRRRRLGFARQMSLLQRIHDAGVRGEEVAESPEEGQGKGLALPVAAPAGRMERIAEELYDYLGDLCRITVTRVPMPGGAWPVIRLYALTREAAPRLVLYPGWSGEEEGSQHEVFPRDRDEMFHKMRSERLPELPIEVLVKR